VPTDLPIRARPPRIERAQETWRAREPQACDAGRVTDNPDIPGLVALPAELFDAVQGDRDEFVAIMMVGA
jgi:hypothetical protein